MVSAATTSASYGGGVVVAGKGGGGAGAGAGDEVGQDFLVLRGESGGEGQDCCREERQSVVGGGWRWRWVDFAFAV